MGSVYVSYSWREEEQTRLVEKLKKACQKRGIELIRDKNQIGYGNSIRTYMDELAAGDHIVLVLSEAYFRSEYCMYELREIYKNRDFRKRVYPIVLEGTPFHKPIERVPYLKYWEDETANLQAGLETLRDPKYTINLRKSLDDYADFHRLMDELQAILSDMNTLTEGIHVGTDFEALLNQLISPDSPAVHHLQHHRTLDSEFQRKIRSEIRRVLNINKHLNDALREELAKLGKPDSAEMAEFLCGNELETALDDLLYPATRASLVAHPQEFDDIWAAAKTVLCWMSLLAVSDEWIKETEQRELMKSDFSFEIIVNTPCGVEIVSSRYRQIPPDLRADKGRADVYGGQIIYEPDGGASWNDDYALEQLLKEIWIGVFPEGGRSRLSDGDLKTLNATLAQREKHKTHHYYIPVLAAQQSRLNRRDFYEKLMAKLPAITVIYVKSTGGAPSLHINDEYDFMTLIREFLIIPEYLGKRA